MVHMCECHNHMLLLLLNTAIAVHVHITNCSQTAYILCVCETAWFWYVVQYRQ